MNLAAEALRYGTRCREISVLPAHPRVYLRIDWTIPAVVTWTPLKACMQQKRYLQSVTFAGSFITILTP